MRKPVFAAVMALVLGLAGMANARTGELDSLVLQQVETATPETLWADMEAEVDSLWNELSPEIAKQRTHYFTPTGPADAHWAERGVDMGALLKGASGGDAANVLYGDDADGPVLQALNATAVAGLAKEWTVVAERRFSPKGETAFISMLAVTPSHLLVSEEAWERTGNGYCPKARAPAPADHMAVYRDSRAPFDAASSMAVREGTAFSIWTALSRAEAPRICWIYVETAPGIYQTRSFDAEGRPLGNMDEGTPRLRIVPAGDLRAMLTARMPPQATLESASAR